MKDFMQRQQRIASKRKKNSVRMKKIGHETFMLESVCVEKSEL